mmetsp:Transcript_54496/g.127311  ORF Transcript_54496/g.127311 Transcript_54496/m.127311 type:complete len:647 (-) Transcript_54496:97-2037(-)
MSAGGGGVAGPDGYKIYASLQEAEYEEIKVIGRGQYGKAHLVVSEKDKQRYIAKAIDLTCLSRKEKEAANQEVELLRKLDHPNIVEYKGSFFVKDTLMIVMNYCEGGDLATYIKALAREKHRMKVEMIMHYFVQVLQALQYIHQMKILHRDLKTSNLFLMTKRSVVKLGDFGISRVLEGSIEAAITVVGTPYYMSPEVCENKPYTFKSDVWSLGCVLYELCMLKHAFSADNLLGLVYKIVSDKYEPIPKRYPVELNNLIKTMLEKNADKRPSVKELFVDLYVTKFMQEYVQTRGQCANPATVAGKPRQRTQDHAGAATVQHWQPSAGHAPGRPQTVSGAAAGLSHTPDSELPRHDVVPRAASGGSDRFVSRSGIKVGETPKEAAERRKREAADKRRRELEQATKQSTQNRTMARRMKEAEFQTTRMTKASIDTMASPKVNDMPSGTTEAPDSVSDDLEPPEEEISEDESLESAEYSSDFCSEVETEGEADVDGHAHLAVGMLSTVQEEQDFTRVMCNYEQDLARGAGGFESPPRPKSDQGMADGVPRFRQTAPQVTRVSSAPTGGGFASGFVMDKCLRNSRLEEDLRRNMGEDLFREAFTLMHHLRKNAMDEKNVRAQMEALLGKDGYATYGLRVDQLVYQLMYSP